MCERDYYKKRKVRSERERNTATKGGDEQISINNNLKCKWIECSNQKK